MSEKMESAMVEDPNPDNLSPAMLKLIEALADHAVREDLGIAGPSPDEEFEARTNYVYRFFDSQGRLLYVGVTCEPKKRHREHRSKAWFHLVARKTTQRFSCRSAALAAESLAIRTEQPIYNGLPKERDNG